LRKQITSTLEVKEVQEELFAKIEKIKEELLGSE
jgi:hypothetical protein